MLGQSVRVKSKNYFIILMMVQLEKLQLLNYEKINFK